MKDVKALKLMTLNDVLSQINGDMTLGIGTGSTMELLLPQMAQLIKERGYNITGVCTSNINSIIN
ncbi:hypothetical protein APW86_03895 [Staphylococcus aureus]|nr:hypothetical protein APW86_03895 [Staphylococcus aureus]